MIYNVGAFVVGLLILAYSNWHIAKRRNEAGVEEYSGFFAMLMHRGFAVALGFVGAGLAILGAPLFVGDLLFK